MKLRLALSLAMASLWHRRGVLALVTLTLTLSVTLLLGVQYLRTEVKQSFSNTISGTDLIVGARSGQLNLLLYTVFHLGDATSNIRWSTYQALAEDPRVAWTVPISLGDSYRGYRVVGTNDSYWEHFRYGDDRALAMADGRWFHGVFEVVLGAEVARQFQHRVGDELTLAHGTGRVSFMNHDAHPFDVVGVLAATGTPVDRAVYVSLAGLEAIHIGWQAGVPIPGRTVSRDQALDRDLTPSSITAALVGLERRVLTFQLQRQLNESDREPLTAILPGVALNELWRILGQFERTLLALTGFVVVTSLVGLAAVLLTLQAQRRQEIRILRAVGASPGLVATLYLLECTLLASLAAVLALVAGSLAVWLAGPWLLEHYGFQVSLRPLQWQEWLLLASVPVAGLLIGLIPAGRAWARARQPALNPEP
ncbi:MAG: ABC transporter permease [Marinobacter sp.]|uniref:ABC transporter permease n=1 Tax=Marinobacter sp. TaxID=50741 RepID=UPI00299E0723|nr:ABC transporter permease [Marinobacter sp.]MDX1633327.1 ABC transporter permease [Marinobacter sp.]